MSAITKIQWTDRTWNPVRGCAVVSPGCTNCYAMRQAHRFNGAGQPYEGLTRKTGRGPVWTGKVHLVPEALDEPLRWRKPCRVFVNSMSDLFHESVPNEFITQIWDRMEETPQHTYQILTKRAERMAQYTRQVCGRWPKNVWMGVSVENRGHVNRIAHLQEIDAAVRFVSFEPLLEDPGPVCLDGIHWAILGGESGPRARSCNLEDIRVMLSRCRSYGVAPFVKQVGARPLYDPDLEGPFHDPKGGDPAEWPEDLRCREYPV